MYHIARRLSVWLTGWLVAKSIDLVNKTKFFFTEMEKDVIEEDTKPEEGW